MSNTAPVLNALALEAKPQNHSGNLIDASQTLQGTCCDHCIHNLTAQSSDEVRVDGTGRDAVYADVALTSLARQSFCERNYARTRSRICCQIGQSFLACKRAHVDNPAPSRAPHERENLAGHLEHTNQVYLKNVSPFASVELLEGLISAEIPSIVYKVIVARRLPGG